MLRAKTEIKTRELKSRKRNFIILAKVLRGGNTYKLNANLMCLWCVCPVAPWRKVTETISSVQKGKIITRCVDYFNVKHARPAHEVLLKKNLTSN